MQLPNHHIPPRGSEMCVFNTEAKAKNSCITDSDLFISPLHPWWKQVGNTSHDLVLQSSWVIMQTEARNTRATSLLRGTHWKWGPSVRTHRLYHLCWCQARIIHNTPKLLRWWVGRTHHLLHLLKDRKCWGTVLIFAIWLDLQLERYYVQLWPCLLIPLTPQTMPDSFRRLLSTTGFWKCQKTDSFFSKYINLSLENVTPKPLSSTMTKILYQVTSTDAIRPHVCPPSVGSPGMFWVSWSVCFTCLLWWWPTNPINSTWIKYPRNNCLHVHIWWIFQTCCNSCLGKST